MNDEGCKAKHVIYLVFCNCVFYKNTYLCKNASVTIYSWETDVDLRVVDTNVDMSAYSQLDEGTLDETINKMTEQLGEDVSLEELLEQQGRKRKSSQTEIILYSFCGIVGSFLLYSCMNIIQRISKLRKNKNKKLEEEE